MYNRNLICGLAGIAFIVMAFTHGLYESVLAVALIAFTLIVFYELRMFVKDPMSVILLILMAFIGLSFLKLGYRGPATYAVIFGFILRVARNRPAFQKAVSADSGVFKSISSGDAITWFILFLFVVSFGFMTSKGFFALDFLHPSYELSIGRSYDLSIFNTPDLSYSGKFLRYHFLSTPLPVYFSYVLKVPVLSSVYFFVPLFLLVLIFLSVHFFFAEFPSVRVPAFLLFFTPLFAFNFVELEGLFQRMVSTNSHLLGFVFVILCVYYLAKERILFFIAAAAFLILIKASFFLVLLGGVVLFYLRTRDFRNLIRILAVLLPIFVVLNKLFLSGAHQHNAWVLFPTILYWGPCMIFIPLVLTWSAVSIYRSYPNDRILLALSAVSLSGMLGAFCLTELTEANSLQFLVGAYFSTVLVFLYWVTHYSFEKELVAKKIIAFLTYSFIALCLVTSFVRIYREPLKDCVVRNIPSSLLKSLPASVSAKIEARKEKSTVLLSKDFIDAYTWLGGNTPANATVLFSKHYEVFMPAKTWWPETGFLRSALSARQMYCENYKYKSIGMEKDFSWRFANSINFYRQFVVPSIPSKEIIDAIYDEGFALALLQKKEAASSAIQKYLNPPKARRWPERTWEIDTQLKEYLRLLPKTKEWALHFLQEAKINYIILEKGDRPSAFLEQIAQQVYANPTISIYKVRPTNLWNL